MKATITTFPYGGGEGLPVARLDVLGEPFDLAAADAELAKYRSPGLWAVWLVGIADWSDPELREFLTPNGQSIDGHPRLTNVVALPLGADDWPPFGCEVVLDASEALTQCSTVEELAGYLAVRGHLHPDAQDLVATIGEAPWQWTTSSMLDMLFEFVQPQDGIGYLYVPPATDFRHKPPEALPINMAIRTAVKARSMWAVRRSHTLPW